jgi:hypothetical protein
MAAPFMEDAMQLTPLRPLILQCADLTKRLERLQQKNRRYNLLAISELDGVVQRVYAVERILMYLEQRTRVVQAEVADAIGDLLETIGLTYGSRKPPAVVFDNRTWKR